MCGAASCVHRRRRDPVSRFLPSREQVTVRPTVSGFLPLLSSPVELKTGEFSLLVTLLLVNADAGVCVVRGSFRGNPRRMSSAYFSSFSHHFLAPLPGQNPGAKIICVENRKITHGTETNLLKHAAAAVAVVVTTTQPPLLLFHLTNTTRQITRCRRRRRRLHTHSNTARGKKQEGEARRGDKHAISHTQRESEAHPQHTAHTATLLLLHAPHRTHRRNTLGRNANTRARRENKCTTFE